MVTCCRIRLLGTGREDTVIVCGVIFRDDAADCVTQDRAASAGSGGRVGDFGEDDLYEWSDGYVGSRLGSRLVNPAALELPPYLPPGAQSRSDELRRSAETS